MKKRLKKLYGKQGLTLVEILVVLIVASVLLLCATGMLAPVNNLLNSVKSNAHMDTACNTVNEYIRGMLEKSEAISIIPYSKFYNDPVTVRNEWKTYTDKYTPAKGYEVRAAGILENYNGDFRLYDFGKVNNIEYTWGTSFEIKTSADGVNPGNAFVLLVRHRDGGGADNGGLNGNDFHLFDAFNEEFYSNGATGAVNYSYEVAFESAGKTLNVDGSSISGVSHLTVNTQVFKRTGKAYKGDILTYEPANQLKSMSFKLLNGNATLGLAANINTVETDAGGTKTIKLPIDETTGKVTRDGLVVLYAIRDIDAYYTMTTPPTPVPSP